MEKINTIEGNLGAQDLKFSIVASRFNEFIVRSLMDGALSSLKRHGASDSDIEIIRVPGAYEIPITVNKIAESKRTDGIIALGVVIRGSTPHFEHISRECTSGISAVMRHHNIPIGFGILTVDTIEQAIERSGSKAGNKGEEAAVSVIEMINLLRRLD